MNHRGQKDCEGEYRLSSYRVAYVFVVPLKPALQRLGCIDTN